MYTFSVDDELAEIVKQAAQNENRTTRGQFRHLLLCALKHEGLYPINQSKGDTNLSKMEEHNET